jgi:hypothetical protein
VEQLHLFPYNYLIPFSYSPTWIWKCKLTCPFSCPGNERGKPCEAGKDWIQIKLSSFVLKDIWDSTSQGLPRIYIFKPGNNIWIWRVALKKEDCDAVQHATSHLTLCCWNGETLKPLIAEVVRKLSTIECWRGGILLGTTLGRRRRMWSWKGWHFAWGITSR